MSRRDTIIIAVLINAGLLVVLFSTALKSNHKEDIAAAAQSSFPVESVTEVSLNKEATPAPQGDEIDQVLRQFSTPTVAVNANPIPQQTQSALIETEKVESKRDFAHDLNAITLTDVQVKQAPGQPVKSKEENKLLEVVVKKGDVLEKIARVNGSTVEEIMRLNHLTSTRLQIGQTLKVAPKSGGREAVREKENRSDMVKYYTVKNGDNPWTIAVKNHMKVEELLKLNQLDQDKARHLKPGDQLRIR
jgi:peptidoglycan DL-endopeptidase LytF